MAQHRLTRFVSKTILFSSSFKSSVFFVSKLCRFPFDRMDNGALQDLLYGWRHISPSLFASNALRNFHFQSIGAYRMVIVVLLFRFYDVKILSMISIRSRLAHSFSAFHCFVNRGCSARTKQFRYRR